MKNNQNLTKKTNKNNTKKVTNKKKTTTNTNQKKSVKTNNINKKKIDNQEKKVETKIVENKTIKKEKKSKKAIILSILVAFIMILGLSILIYKEYPKMKEQMEIKQVEKEINSLIEEKDLDKVKDKTKENITSKERNDYENAIESYLINTLELKKEIDSIKENNTVNNLYDISNENIIKEHEKVLEDLNNLSNKVTILKEEQESLKFSSDNINNSYKKLSNKINDNYDFKEIETIKNEINEAKPFLEYLIKNKNNYKLEEDITFLKRSKYNEFDKLVKGSNCTTCSNLKYKLIEDKKGPTITASDITITEGTKLNIKDKVKCYDEVDDMVDCIISGTFNSSKVGTYSITIKSTDKSSNTSSKTIKVNVKAKQVTTNKAKTTTVTRNSNVTGDKPYYIEVIRNQNVVIVYGKDSNNKYNKVVKVFVVSVGRSGKTPTGTYKTTKGYAWGSLINGVWGQYTTRITGSYLFHSVPYYTKNKGNLEWQEYNKLGTAASAGCVRMTVRDAKWIYDNISNGTTVKIYDGSLPSGVTKPSAPKISASSSNKGWDPTDPDPNNPWRK